MNQQQQPPRHPFQETMSLISFLVCASHILSTPHELLWRVPGSTGKRYFGMNALLAFVVAIPLAVWVCPPTYGAVWVIRAWWIQTALLLLHRVARVRRKHHVHSYYLGDSWLTRLFGMRQTLAKSGGELVAAALLAYVLIPLCNTLAFIVFAGGLINWTHMALIDARDQRMVENALDQRIDALHLGSRLREFD